MRLKYLAPFLVLAGCSESPMPSSDTQVQAPTKLEQPVVVAHPENEVYINCRSSNYHGFEDYRSYIRFNTANKKLIESYIDFEGITELDDLRSQVLDDTKELKGYLIWQDEEIPYSEGSLYPFREYNQTTVPETYYWTKFDGAWKYQLDRTNLKIYFEKKHSSGEVYSQGLDAVCSMVDNQTELESSIVENTILFKETFKAKLESNKF